LFSCNVSKHVNRVLAYEPEPENLELLRKNLEINSCANVTDHARAVVGHAEHGATLDFYINDRFSDKAVHTLTPIRGRQKITVGVEGIDKILLRNPINKIKMDIEGGEQDVCNAITAGKLWEPIQELLMEYHFNIIKDKDHSVFVGIMNDLKAAGFKVHHPAHEGRNLWNIFVHAVKS
jgi:FkbM family methyltransferase